MKYCRHCGKELQNILSSKRIFCNQSCRNKYHHSLNPNRPKGYVNRVLATTKHRAKKQNIPFNLGFEDIVVPEYCPVLGIKLTSGTNGSKRNSPSIDKLIPNKGYIKGNIRIISNRANTLKNDASIEELEKVLEDLKRLRSD